MDFQPTHISALHIKIPVNVLCIQLLLALKTHTDLGMIRDFHCSVAYSVIRVLSPFLLWSKETIRLHKPQLLIPSFALIIIESSDCAALRTPPIFTLNSSFCGIRGTLCTQPQAIKLSHSIKPLSVWPNIWCLIRVILACVLAPWILLCGQWGLSQSSQH